MGTNTGAAAVHATEMSTQCFHARESMQVQCEGAMADVKMLPTFNAKRSPRFFNDVLHDILEGNPDLQLVVVWPSGEDPEHIFMYLKLLSMGMAARRRCVSRTWMMTSAWTSEQMPPKGPLGEKHQGKDLCSIAFAFPWKRIQICQVPCTSLEVHPLTTGVSMGQEQLPLGCG